MVRWCHHRGKLKQKEQVTRGLSIVADGWQGHPTSIQTQLPQTHISIMLHFLLFDLCPWTEGWTKPLIYRVACLQLNAESEESKKIDG